MAIRSKFASGVSATALTLALVLSAPVAAQEASVEPGDQNVSEEDNGQGEEIVVNFKIFGQNFIGLNGGPQFPHSEAISFQIPCADQAEIDKYWQILTADGGQESQCGWLKDKFGISWQVTSPEMMKYLGGSDTQGSQRATQAMLEMKKIDLAAMEKAYKGA